MGADVVRGRKRKVKTIAFAIVVTACLFAPERHECLFISSIVGLWMAALSEHEIGEGRKNDE